MNYKKYSPYQKNTNKSMKRENKRTKKRTTLSNSNSDISMKNKTRYCK